MNKRLLGTVGALLGFTAIASACNPQEQLDWWRLNNTANGGKAAVTVELGEQIPAGFAATDQLNVDVASANVCSDLGATNIWTGFGITQCQNVDHDAARSYLAGSPAPTPPDANTQAVTVTGLVDGDTIDTNVGRIRILGYDTPERGECGYDDATQTLNHFLNLGSVTLSADTGDNTDRYGRYLRHVLVNGDPVGLMMINAGKANARYDSLDGYPRHRYQDQYRAADGPNSFNCNVAPAPAAPPSSGGGNEPWNSPGPDLDCKDIGKKVRITGTDYHRLDRDGDGWGCESYG